MLSKREEFRCVPWRGGFLKETIVISSKRITVS